MVIGFSQISGTTPFKFQTLFEIEVFVFSMKRKNNEKTDFHSQKILCFQQQQQQTGSSNAVDIIKRTQNKAL